MGDKIHKKRQKKSTDTKSRGSRAPQTTIFGVHEVGFPVGLSAMGGSASPSVPPVPKMLPPVLPPISGGSTLKSQNCATPHFGGEPLKFSGSCSPQWSPPFRGGAPKILEILQDTPKIFFALRAEKILKNLDLPLKTPKFSSRFARKDA